MNKIFNITERLEDKKRKEQVELYSHKIQTVQRIVLCSSCHLRCAMCGNHLRDFELSCPKSSSQLGSCLCESCRGEFEDYLEMSRGKKGSGSFWHNREWMKLWSAWLDYHRAIREFRDSTEFKQLAKEIDS